MPAFRRPGRACSGVASVGHARDRPHARAGCWVRGANRGLDRGSGRGGGRKRGGARARTHLSAGRPCLRAARCPAWRRPRAGTSERRPPAPECAAFDAPDRCHVRVAAAAPGCTLTFGPAAGRGARLRAKPPRHARCRPDDGAATRAPRPWASARSPDDTERAAGGPGKPGRTGAVASAGPDGSAATARAGRPALGPGGRPG